MSEQELNNTKTIKSRNNNILVVLLLLLLITSAVFNYFLYKNAKQNEDALNLKLISAVSLQEDLKKEVDRYKSEVSVYKGKYDELDVAIAAKEKDIMAKAARIEKLLHDNKLNYSQYLEAREEIKTLRAVSDRYEREIAALTAKNQELTADVEKKTKELTKVKDENNGLRDENASSSLKLSLAKQLKAESIVVTGIELKGDKERETDRAKRANRIKVSFSIPENLIAVSGKRTVYIKVLNSRGEPVFDNSSGSGTFTYLGSPSIYSAKQEILYDVNDEVPDKFFVTWNRGNTFDPGQYKMELYTEGYMMGEKVFELK